jgi:hypothetical protein
MHNECVRSKCQHSDEESLGKNLPPSVNFVYAWQNYPTSTKSKLCGSPFPSIDVKLFCFCISDIPGGGKVSFSHYKQEI